MKFIKLEPGHPMSIPRTALNLCGFVQEEMLEYHPMEDVLVIMRKQMTAIDLISAAFHLRQLSNSLFQHLAEFCGSCRECSEDCKPLDTVNKPIDLPDDILTAAGIPKGAKLCAQVNPITKAVTVTEADYEYDLRDLPPEIILCFEENGGICLSALDRELKKNAVVYGG